MKKASRQPSSGSIKLYTEDPVALDLTKKKFWQGGILGNSSGGYTGVTSFQNGRTSVSTIKSQSSNPKTRSSYALSTTSSTGQVQNIENWINQKSLQRIQERHSAESSLTKQMYMTLLHNEENFVKGIDHYLEETELLNLRRREFLHKQWNEQVYEPIRRRIESTIEQGYPLLDQNKREDYLKYLKYKNKKGDVFLDTISPDEYDPLSLMHRDSPTSLKVQTPRLQDPLLVQERKRIDEDKTVLHCKIGKLVSDDFIRSSWLPALPLVPLGRHGTTCNVWLSMPIRDMESPVRIRSRKCMKGDSHASAFNFESWGDIDPHKTNIVDQELRIQKRRRFKTPLSISSAKQVMELDDGNGGLKSTDHHKSQVRFSLPAATPITPNTQQKTLEPIKAV